MGVETGTQDLLSLAMAGAPSNVLVQNVAKLAKLLSPQDTRAAVLVRDGARGTLKVAGSDGFDDDFVAHAQEIPVRHDYPSCGRCAATGAEVFVRDVSVDPQWAPHLSFAQEHGIRACWSFPILGRAGVLGTIAIYHRIPRAPRAIEADAIRYLAAIASVALSSDSSSSDQPHAG